MPPGILPACSALAAALFPVASALAASGASGEAAEILFVRRITPLFAEQCLACHGQDEAKIKGGLDLRSRDALLRGGDSGIPSLVPGSPDQSPLYLASLRSHQDWEPMPPKEADRLTGDQLASLRDWITAGAPWPDAARAAALARAHADAWSAEDGVTVPTSGGLSADWTNRRYDPEGLWAYRPVRKPDTASPAPIDELIARRRPEGLEPVPPADRLTLLRRVTFDLTGLPPSPEEIAAFRDDPAPDDLAFAKVVDRLLASPHYGERMARHWLDVTRYADSSGFANDYERGNAWRYRDFVVRAFNEDKPYDRFVREQIAGDELDPENPEMLVATGFLRMGPWELTGMEVAKIARQRFLDDVVNSVGETFLAHSLQCARCHDHKFDPVPTRDYYAIQAVFATTQLAERPAPFLPSENTAGFGERAYLEQRRAAHVAKLGELNRVLLDNARRWFRDTGKDPSRWNEAVARAKNPEFQAIRNALANQGVPESDYPPKLVGFTPEQFGAERVARKGLERLAWELERYEPYALAVYDGLTPHVKSVYRPVRPPADPTASGERERTCILPGGDPFATGEPVRPGVLSAVPLAPPAIPDALAGRRRAFADWVAHPGNPLTARAIVNRVWLWHFDRPIAGNPNNFGSTGKRPTHPELLDWLAATFVEQGWSFKALHRLILTSEAYRRAPVPAHASGETAAALAAAFLAFPPRRLSAEELRDAMLAATGELNPTLGGIPNRPEINLEAALQPRQVMGTFASAWVPNPLPAQRHRRSLYALRLRGLTDPLLEVFNAPAPDFSCERREASTVTPQVFALFNGRTVHDRALALAHRAVSETPGRAEAVARCFLLALSRPPSPEELRRCLDHWGAAAAALETSPPPPAPEPPRTVRRDAVEENTGEKFSFEETLHAYADFVPDLQPADVSPATRALAEVCLTLFNTHEFAYVY